MSRYPPLPMHHHPHRYPPLDIGPFSSMSSTTSSRTMENSELDAIMSSTLPSSNTLLPLHHHYHPPSQMSESPQSSSLPPSSQQQQQQERQHGHHSHDFMLVAIVCAAFSNWKPILPPIVRRHPQRVRNILAMFVLLTALIASMAHMRLWLWRNSNPNRNIYLMNEYTNFDDDDDDNNNNNSHTAAQVQRTLLKPSTKNQQHQQQQSSKWGISLFSFLRRDDSSFVPLVGTGSTDSVATAPSQDDADGELESIMTPAKMNNVPEDPIMNITSLPFSL